MIRIEASTLYTRQDLAELLKESGVDVDFFVGRIRPKKVFRMIWLGADILEAIRTAPALAEREDRAEPLPVIPGRKRGTARKQDAIPGAGRLIGGIFSPADLGISK